MDQHGRTTLAVAQKSGQPNERRRKAEQNERSHREGHAGWAGRVKNFQALAMLKRHRRDVIEMQPESEEARPVAWGERAVKSGG